MTAISELENPISTELPKTLAEFLKWEPEDGFKYEWNDGKIIQFRGLNRYSISIYANIIRKLMNDLEYENGMYISKPDIMLTPTQLRRPDIAFYSEEQILKLKNEEDTIPEYVIEVISENDNIIQIEERTTEYFKAGVKVVWNIYPEPELVYVYTSRKQVQICMDDDICSATPVLPEFEVKVSTIFE